MLTHAAFVTRRPTRRCAPPLIRNPQWRPRPTPLLPAVLCRAKPPTTTWVHVPLAGPPGGVWWLDWSYSPMDSGQPVRKPWVGF